MMRPSKVEYYLAIAKQVARRGTCLRRNFGAVIVNDDQIVSTGYTGAPRGAKNCIDLGFCLREKGNIPSGERYELCRSVHAEMNAVIHASRREMVGGVLFLAGLDYKTGDPINSEVCMLCKRVIINAGLKYVYSAIKKGFRKTIVESWLIEENFSTEKGRKDKEKL